MVRSHPVDKVVLKNHQLMTQHLQNRACIYPVHRDGPTPTDSIMYQLTPHTSPPNVNVRKCQCRRGT